MGADLSLAEKINICLETRAKVANIIGSILSANTEASETQLREELLKVMAKRTDIYPSGWYDPPPSGIGLLIAQPDNNYERSKYPTLRTEPNWPHADYKLDEESVGMVYVSPVHKDTGVIADIGLNFYTGSNKNIQNHLSYSLETVEKIAEQSNVGIRFNDLHKLAQQIVDARGLHNDWMITINDPTRAANFGHSFPWTHEKPSLDEQAIIDQAEIDQLKTLIEKKRLFINPIETAAIPETIAFSIEARLGSRSNDELPCGYYYALVTFCEGERKIITNYNTIFDAIGITYMRSKFE